MDYSFSELIQFIEELTELFDSTSLMAYDVSTLLTVIMSVLTLIGSILTTGIGLIIFIGSLIVSAVSFVLFYVLLAVPVFAIARKVKYKYAWLAWIPVYHQLFCLYVLYKCSGKSSFEFANGKVKMDGTYAFLIYLLVYFFGDAIVTLLIGVLNLLPIIGQILSLITMLLYLAPTAICAIIEYVYLRDVLDIFKPNKKSNRTHATVVSVLDALITFGLARNFYLFTIMKRQPILNGSSAIDDETLPLMDAPVENVT